MGEPRNAAIYVRISSDQDGLGLGVERQLKDCVRLAQDLGWQVAEVYQDNDVSASTGRARPAYLRMVDDIARGERDGVLVYHQDRLHRDPLEFEHFRTVLEKHGTPLRFVAGLSGLADGDGDGLLALRIMSAVAANETATKKRRVRRKMRANAEAGLPHGGPNRPFGFEDDKITHRPDEVAVVRECAARVIGGESLRSIAAALGAEGVTTTTGKPWQSTNLRVLLRNPRIAGLRDHKGEIVGPAVWDPIITVEQRDLVLRALDARSTSNRRAPRRYLLSGMLRCGKCGERLYSAARRTTRRYVCQSGPDHGGCGGLTVVAAPVEDLIHKAVLIRLDSPEMVDVLAGRTAADERTAGLIEQLTQDRAQLEELAAVYAQRQITVKEWMAARNPIEARIRSTEQQITRASDSAELASIVGHGNALSQSWSELNLDRQAAIVRAVLDHAVIHPSNGGRRFDPNRVQALWVV